MGSQGQRRPAPLDIRAGDKRQTREDTFRPGPEWAKFHGEAFPAGENEQT
jgi:hypothetical protein